MMPRKHRNTSINLPRLTAMLQNQCALSLHEAWSCIDMHRIGISYAGEAVGHYGGTKACLIDAFKRRHMGRSYRWLRYGYEPVYR